MMQSLLVGAPTGHDAQLVGKVITNAGQSFRTVAGNLDHRPVHGEANRIGDDELRRGKIEF